LRCGAFGDMHVHEGLVEEFRIGLVLLQMGAYVAVGDLRRLTHHFAELAGDLEAPIETVHAVGLDRQGSAAHGVQARPVITPTPLSTFSGRNTGVPSRSFKSAGRMLIFWFGSSSRRMTDLRTSLASCFSRLRTPDSRA